MREIMNFNLEEAAAFLDEGAGDHSPYLDKLREAGGNKKVKLTDDVNARLNFLTGQVLIKACAVCGVMTDVKACSGCNSVMYCSKACQKLHWKDHKASCKEYANNLSNKTGFNAHKWFNSMPMMQHMRTAVAMGNRLPVVDIVDIVVGKNERKCVVGFHGCDTQEDLVVHQQQHPGLANMFRFDEEKRHDGLTRVVVVVNHGAETTAFRMLV